MVDERACLHQKRQWLTDASGGSCDDCMGCQRSGGDAGGLTRCAWSGEGDLPAFILTG